MDLKTLKTIGMIATIAGAAISVVGSAISDKQMETMIKEEVVNVFEKYRDFK